MKFLNQFIKNPIKTGAIAPSSKRLAQLITDTANLSEKKCVVELGSGTGVFTKEILRKISSDCVFFCLEINQKFVDMTKKNCPEATVYQASANDINKYLLKHKQKYCDCIISGIPWVGMRQEKQKELLDIIYDSLTEGGEFLTFAYIHGTVLEPGKRFKELLLNKFSKVEKTKTINKNIPPALVYHCIK